YFMKRLAMGSVQLDIEGFRSGTEIYFTDLKAQLEQGRAVATVPATSRFWFTAGSHPFTDGRDSVWLQKSSVILLTEQQFLSKEGQFTGSGKPEPTSKAFAESFTAKYDEIARVKPIYQELKALYRFVALAR